MFQYKDVVTIGENCLLIAGRHLNVQRGEADVANAIIYKKGHRLYIIDTGALVDFRETLFDVCNTLKPFEEIVLINTHGHGDHVGNNCVIDQLEARKKSHFVSAHDLDMMLDNRKFFKQDFKKIEPFLAEGQTAESHIKKLLDLFEPLEVDSRHLDVLESLAATDILIGNIHWSGWKFNDEVFVLRTQGHSAGHVIVYFPEFKHIHMADETNGYCNLFHDCDHLKSLESHTKTLSMINEGTVVSMSDGHTFELHNHAEAKTRLESLINAHYVFGNELRKMLANEPNGLPFDVLVQNINDSQLIKKLPAGANPNPTYLKLQLLSKFKDLGVIADSEEVKTARFKFNIY